MTIFDDIAAALAPFVGGTGVAGAILAIAFIVTIFLCIELVLSTTRHGGGGGDTMNTLLISVFIGFIFSAVVGWLPIWVPFLLLLYIAWIVLDPMGSRGGQHAG